jgi:hypothetical protein
MIGLGGVQVISHRRVVIRYEQRLRVGDAFDLGRLGDAEQAQKCRHQIDTAEQLVVNP